MNAVENGMEEDDLKAECNLVFEDPGDKVFMKWSLEEIQFYQHLLICVEKYEDNR